MVQDLPHIYILNLNNKDHILPIQIKKIIKKKKDSRDYTYGTQNWPLITILFTNNFYYI